MNEWRDFVERNDHSVGAREAAVHLAVDVEDGVPLRHLADLFQVERLRPNSVETNESEAKPEEDGDEQQLEAEPPLALLAGDSALR